MIGLGLGQCYPDATSGPSCTDLVLDWPESQHNATFISAPGASRTVETGQSIAGVDDAIKLTLSADANSILLQFFMDEITDPHASVTFSLDVFTASSGIHIDRVFVRGFSNDSSNDANGIFSVTPGQWNTFTKTYNKTDTSGLSRTKHQVFFNANPNIDSNDPDIPSSNPIYFKNLRFSYSCQSS
tara:strand:- start:19 stop:573 length:555 start_codon:yes stop_codon:yes gene_type:complete